MRGWSEDKGRGQRLEQAAKVCDPQTCCPAPQEVAEATGGGMGSKRASGLQQGHPRGPQLRPSKGTRAMVPAASLADDLPEAVQLDGAPSPRHSASGGAHGSSSVPPPASPWRVHFSLKSGRTPEASCPVLPPPPDLCKCKGPGLLRTHAQGHGSEAQPHSELLPWEQACYVSSLVRGELCLQIHMSKS